MSGALVIGYGSPIRGDDAVGWRVAEVLQDDPRLAAATVLARHQLTPELADDVAGADVVVLVDAVVDQAPGTVEVTQVVARVAAGASSHELDPGGLLALATRIHHRAPPAYVVRVGAACIEPGEELSVAVDAALPAIVEEVARLASTSGLISRSRIRRDRRPLLTRHAGAMAWLPDDFSHPTRLDLPTGHHLRLIRATDVDLDLPAVMGSRDRLWSIYGEAWGWPPATMTLEQDREDLAHHEAEIEAHESFNYAVFDAEETELLGCVYIDPPEREPEGVDAVVSWWVVDDAVGSPLEAALDEAVPAWLAAAWPFQNPRFGV